MAERERSHTRPLGGVFVAHSQVMTAADVQRALTRMAHEVVERNGGASEVVLVGLQTGGVPLAAKMAEVLRQIEPETDLATGSTGRTIRAALNALNDFGRARAVQLAVMVDRDVEACRAVGPHDGAAADQERGLRQRRPPPRHRAARRPTRGRGWPCAPPPRWPPAG